MDLKVLDQVENKVKNKKKQKIQKIKSYKCDNMSKKTQQPPQLKRQLKPKTKNQAEYIRAIVENQITFVTGPAGCGKSMIATALSCEYILQGKVDKIIITRPIVEAGRSQGFLPGNILEKSMPYMIPIIDELNLSLDPVFVQALIREGRIEILPLAYMRGRNFHNSFVIADEMSNATKTELKLLLTRIGMNSKLIITGDLKQSDLPLYEQGGLDDCIKKLDNLEDIAIVKLYDEDIIRNPLIARILERLN